MDPVQFPPARSLQLELPGPREAHPSSGPSFGNVLEAALESVSQAQTAGDDATRAFALGSDVDLHSVLLAVEKADLSFRTMMEVRNKLIAAYQEVMRMQF